MDSIADVGLRGMSLFAALSIIVEHKGKQKMPGCKNSADGSHEKPVTGT
jgi:hypothetical protein